MTEPIKLVIKAKDEKNEYFRAKCKQEIYAMADFDAV